MGVASDLEQLARATRNPGRLCLAPSTTSGGFPYGGTQLGLHTECELDFSCTYVDVFDPASGVYVESERLSVEVPSILCVVDGPYWDEDVLQAVFQKTSAGAVAFPKEVRLEGTLNGTPTTTAWQPMLFAPYDPQHKAIYFRRPMPRLSLRRSVQLAQQYKAGLPLLFRPTPDAAWATTPYWQVARVENLSL